MIEKKRAELKKNSKIDERAEFTLKDLDPSNGLINIKKLKDEGREEDLIKTNDTRRRIIKIAFTKDISALKKELRCTKQRHTMLVDSKYFEEYKSCQPPL